MNNYLLLAISVFTASSKSLLTKQLKTKEKNYAQIFVDSTVAFVVALAIVFVSAIFSGQNLFYTLPIPLAVCYALFTLLSQIFLLLAMGSGSVSISVLFYSCGFIIPTFFGAIRYGEKLTIFHLIAVVLIVISCVLGTNHERGKKFNLRWLIYVISGLVCSGLVGVCQKVFKTEYKGLSLNGFLVVAFSVIVLISIAISVLMTLKLRKRGTNWGDEKAQEIKKELKLRMIFSILLGVSISVVNLLNTHLSGVLPSALFFPCVNGGVMSITAIGSAVIFKEKLNAKKIVGIVLCVIAIVLTTL